MAKRTRIFLNAKFDVNLIKPIFIYLKNFENQRSAQHPFSVFFPINKAFYKVVVRSARYPQVHFWAGKGS